MFCLHRFNTPFKSLTPNSVASLLLLNSSKHLFHKRCLHSWLQSTYTHTHLYISTYVYSIKFQYWMWSYDVYSVCVCVCYLACGCTVHQIVLTTLTSNNNHFWKPSFRWVKICQLIKNYLASWNVNNFHFVFQPFILLKDIFPFFWWFHDTIRTVYSTDKRQKDFFDLSLTSILNHQESARACMLSNSLRICKSVCEKSNFPPKCFEKILYILFLKT